MCLDKFVCVFAKKCFSGKIVNLNKINYKHGGSNSGKKQCAL
jgi:hypothetical protein